MSDARYIDIPGNGTHELPPLLLNSLADHSPAQEAPDLASVMPEAEDMLAASDATEEVLEHRKFELAVQLTERYQGLRAQWQWGDSILEWIRQCEITFEGADGLRQLLHPDVWPHASRSSFVTLLEEKQVAAAGMPLERAVGLRLTFRQPPPIDCCSNQFLLYLNSTVADTAYRTWSHLVPGALMLLPPHRFHFEVVNIGN